MLMTHVIFCYCAHDQNLTLISNQNGFGRIRDQMIKKNTKIHEPTLLFNNILLGESQYEIDNN